MALSLGVKVGAVVGIGEYFLKVLDIINPTNVLISVRGEEFRLSDLEKVEVLPNVSISCGPSKFFEKYARLAIEAPRHIQINRISK